MIRADDDKSMGPAWQGTKAESGTTLEQLLQRRIPHCHLPASAKPPRCAAAAVLMSRVGGSTLHLHLSALPPSAVRLPRHAEIGVSDTRCASQRSETAEIGVSDAKP